MRIGPRHETTLAEPSVHGHNKGMVVLPRSIVGIADGAKAGIEVLYRSGSRPYPILERRICNLVSRNQIQIHAVAGVARIASSYNQIARMGSAVSYAGHET